MAPTLKNILAQIAIPIFWVSLVIAGFWQLFVYANTPGAQASAPARWPTGSKIQRGIDTPTLLIFAHPQCPCTKASIGELERLMPHIKDKIKTYVIFYKPQSKQEGWVKDSLWQKALTIPSVSLTVDEDGGEIDRFNVNTSGQALLYDKDGVLVFKGGITPERGHMGDSEGRLAILAFAEKSPVTNSIVPVYGCSVKNPERAPARIEK